MHELVLLNDLGWVMVAAALAAVIFQRIRQPVILGYLLAGVLIGPSLFPDWSPIHGIESISELSELGVLFLMFFIGLEFDLTRLKQILGPSLVALVFQTVLMLFLGLQAGQLMGWSYVQSFFLGGILSISSSMVTIKLIRERGEQNRPYAHSAVGILILEDFLAIILLVVLAGVAVNGSFDWDAAGQTTLFIGIFVVAAFSVGKLVAPKVVEVLHHFGSKETIVLFTLGSLLGMSLLAAKFHFSLALGGFLAGAILSKSSLAEEIEELMEPLRDFFSAVFFVTVGMLVEPSALLASWFPILTITVLMMVGKLASCWTGLALVGQRPSVALRASLAKSQIGEFGFVIAALGVSLDVADGELKAVASGVAILSILLTPAASKLAEPLSQAASRYSPRALSSSLRIYQSWFAGLRLSANRDGMLGFAMKPILRVLVNFLLLNAIVIISSIFADHPPLPSGWEEFELFVGRGIWLVAAAVCIPFLIDIMRSLNVLILIVSEIVMNRTPAKMQLPSYLRDALQWVVFGLVVLIFGITFFGALSPYFPRGAALAGFVITALVLSGVAWRKIISIHSRLEMAVIDSLQDQSRHVVKHSIVRAMEQASERRPWPVGIDELVITKGSLAAGARIRHLALPQDSGAIIVAVQRGGLTHYDLGPDFPLSPGDVALLLGEPEQLRAAIEMLRQPGTAKTDAAEERTFSRVLVDAASNLAGLTLAEAKLRNRYGVTVVGIQRDDDRRTMLSAQELLLGGDILLVMGTEPSIARLQEDAGPSLAEVENQAGSAGVA